MDLPKIFKGETDRFSGITVSSLKEPKKEEEFEQCLLDSLDSWKNASVRGIWFKIGLEFSHWIPILAKNGFRFHHAHPTYATMVKWLPMDEPDNIPKFAHTMLGVGAFVVNEDDELLVVKERFSPISQWKLPGGYVEPGEDIGPSAEREVLEETGVKAEFQWLMSVRHIHKVAFGCSDLYFIVHLKPNTKDIVMCQKELVGCAWMKLSEYLEHPKVHDTNKFFAQCFLEARTNQVCIEARHQPLKFHTFYRDQMIYSIKPNHNMTDNYNTNSNSSAVSNNAASNNAGEKCNSDAQQNDTCKL